MTVYRTDTLPEPAAAGECLFGIWRVGTPRRQTATIEAIATAWQDRPWPATALTSYAVLAGDDGDTLLHVSALDTTAGQVRPDPSWKHDVDTAVPGIRRVGVTACRLHRATPRHGHVDDANCVVFVTREFDPPDLTECQSLIDTMFTAATDTPAAPGMIGAHFYTSLDGAHVYNYALWTSAAVHHHAITTPSPTHPTHSPTTTTGNAPTTGPP
ncbi:hypothetical protein [Mycolicibacterium sp.]|uniref:hypothetical protein n=1 Tax=Mycolicibacterium sp. TaxID=2320850 RepID=UPI0037C7AC7A